jgi:hypothetical protein
MPSYCLLADLKTYLNASASADDDLLQLMLDAATNRIDSHTGRTFQAAGDTTRTYDPTKDIFNNALWLDQDLSYLTSCVNGDTTNITTSIVTNPRNETPYYSLGIKSSSSVSWTYLTDYENAISVTGRFAYMGRETITALSRSTNVVTATVTAPRLSVGVSVWVVGCADTSFNGTFTVTSNTGSAITWAQTAGNDTDTTAYLLYTPTDIVTACRRLAAWMYRQKDTQQGDQDRPILAGDGSIIMPTTLPLDVEKILRPYIRRVRN